MEDSRSKKECLLIAHLGKGEPALSIAPNIQLSMMSGVHELSQLLNAYLKDSECDRSARVGRIHQALKKPGTMEVLDYLHKLNNFRPFALNKAWMLCKTAFAGVEKTNEEVVIAIGEIYTFTCRHDYTTLTLQEVRNRAKLDFTLR